MTRNADGPMGGATGPSLVSNEITQQAKGDYKMAASFVYTAVFALTLASGEVIDAEGESYSTEDACLMQSEADAKLIAREWAWQETQTGRKGFYKSVEVWCERQHGSKGHVGR